MIIATFDLSAGWSFKGTPEADFGICFVDGDSDRAYPTRLSFGYEVKVNGVTADTHVWPPENIRIREVSRDNVFPYRVEAQPGDEIVLDVWASNAGLKVDGSTSWTIPTVETGA